ncbi:hypothetical protein H0H93_016880 [Arthromyces matolae]|nr:hypothetical protein H0H93_016880 [Arthromyces matolae]
MPRQATDLTKTSQHDRIIFDNDFEVIHARESYRIRVGNSSRVVENQRSPQRGRTSWVQGSQWEPEDNPELALDPDGDWYDEEVEGSVLQEPSPRQDSGKPRKKKTRTKVSKRPMVYWKTHHRQKYLDELLRFEGRADARIQTHCIDCLARKNGDPGDAEIRCRDCFGMDLVCPLCCVKRHVRLPFHRVERWTGTHFVTSSLKDLGLTLQLNHLSMRCSAPQACHIQMRVLHTNGIHDVALKYCTCRPLPPHIQLLRRGLYPASQLRPKTCVTFELLRQLHLLSLNTKASTYDLYQTLESLTDNTGLKFLKSRYKALQRVLLQWRHLVMLKRGGRAHHPSGADGTEDGELAVRCLTCPHPGINIPEGWNEDSSPYLYALRLAMDANFRLKQQLVSSYSQDPGLGIGLSYMVKREPYESYLLDKASQGDHLRRVRCLGKSKYKIFEGTKIHRGWWGIVCKRYPNMDYILASSLRFYRLLLLLICYDIMCQWVKNLFLRMKGWPSDLRLDQNAVIIPGIPKLHEPAHKEGHDDLSMNHILGAGLTDGECQERIWAGHNALGNSTKTMGPGSRHDVLDDHFGRWNWLKYCSMGRTLMRKYKGAIRLRNVQKEAHRGFTASIDATKVAEWESMCSKWETDRTYPRKTPSPFVSDVVVISEAEVRKELAEEEKARIIGGGVALHETSASGFLVLGLELEEIQRRIIKLGKPGQTQTPTHGATLLEQRNSLRIKLKSWEQLRSIYIPGLLQHLSSSSPISSSPDIPEKQDLWLPSQLPPETRQTACISGLSEMEVKLRIAQCHDALEGLRHVLRLKTRMIQFKNANIRGQKNSTRSRAIIDRVHERARGFTEKYRACRERILALSGPGDWENMLRPLQDRDVRAYTDPEKLQRRTGRRGTVEDEVLALSAMGGATAEEDDDDMEAEEGQPPMDEDISLIPEPRSKRDGTGETRRELSWIWTTGTGRTTDIDDEDLLRSEWAKSRARCNRATEEVSLLREEMRRSLQFLQWKGSWWRKRTTLRKVEEKELAEGLKAYALEQASLQENLVLSFRRTFKSSIEDDDSTPKANINSAPAPVAEDDDDDDDDNDNDDDDGDDNDDGDDDDGNGNDDDDSDEEAAQEP